MDTVKAREFKCEGCGYDIYSIGYDDGKNVCGLCRWLDEFVHNPKEREKIIKLVRHEDEDEGPETPPTLPTH